MSQPNGCRQGMPWVTPYLTVKDADAALAFYERAFGFTKRQAMPGQDGTTWHAEMTWNDGVVMFGKEGAYGGRTQAPATSGASSPVTIYVYCADADALYARATANGAKSLCEPVDTCYGDRMCSLADPDGHIWCFATHRAADAAAA